MSDLDAVEYAGRMMGQAMREKDLARARHWQNWFRRHRSVVSAKDRIRLDKVFKDAYRDETVF